MTFGVGVNIAGRVIVVDLDSDADPFILLAEEVDALIQSAELAASTGSEYIRLLVNAEDERAFEYVGTNEDTALLVKQLKQAKSVSENWEEFRSQKLHG